MQQKVELEEFYIMGISVTTTNQNGQSQKNIGELWQRYFADNLTVQIKNKLTDEIYCVYTNYESDFNGKYTTIIGSKVSSINAIPEGLTGIVVPRSNYLSFISTGKLPDSVVATWQRIWQMPINRKYIADFDVYGEKAQDPANAIVETYVSVF